MPGWNEIVTRVETNLETVAKECLSALKNHTNRNVIVYFSAWQQKKNIPGALYGIDDNDLNGFMNSIRGMDKQIGLDLVLHTPGGEIGAAQKIVEYLKNVFSNNFRVFVPHSAMSAGTMIACASSVVYMGRHSFLGPIDPQINGIPTNEFKNTIQRMKDDLNNNRNVAYWIQYMQQLPPQLEGVVENVIEHSKQLVKEWLSDNMLNGDALGVDRTVEYLSNYSLHREHNNCLNITHLRSHTDLNIIALEDDEVLQDLVLSVYHAFQILVGRTSIAKIITNHDFEKFVVNHG